jgi:hypothetical protein
MRHPSLAEAALVLCIAASAAQAQAPLEVHKANGVYYVSGGVSDADRKRMETMAKDYNLHLDIAQGNGSYLPGVSVGVEDGHGNWVVKARSEGPIFYVQMAPGAYRVEATAPDGRKVSMSAFVPRNGSRALEIRFQPQGQ